MQATSEQTEIREEFRYLDYAPILFVSAVTNND